jgi:MerR family transcriptional regulator/heat shock protein HspR
MNKEKPIMTISMAAKLLRLHPRTLMLYERSGLIMPYRTATKRRLFSFNDLAKLQFIRYLTRQEGVNLKGVKIILRAIRLAERKGIKLRKLLFPSFKSKPLV